MSDDTVTCGGTRSLGRLNTFQWDSDGDENKVDKIMERFEWYCNPRKNLTFERHTGTFFSRN